jgi:hypothetical protein
MSITPVNLSVIHQLLNRLDPNGVRFLNLLTKNIFMSGLIFESFIVKYVTKFLLILYFISISMSKKMVSADELHILIKLSPPSKKSLIFLIFLKVIFLI